MIHIPRPRFNTICRAISDCAASEGLHQSAVNVLARYVEAALCRDLDNWERRVGEADDLHRQLTEAIVLIEGGDVILTGDDAPNWRDEVKTTLLECEEIKF